MSSRLADRLRMELPGEFDGLDDDQVLQRAMLLTDQPGSLRDFKNAFGEGVDKATGRRMAQGFGNQVMFGFGSEAAEATAPLVQNLMGAADYAGTALQGGDLDKAAARWEAAIEGDFADVGDISEDELRKGRSDAPVAMGAAEFAGGLTGAVAAPAMLGAANAARGAQGLGNAINAARAGANANLVPASLAGQMRAAGAEGALSGAGNAPEGKRLQGALAGGALGAAVPPMLRGARVAGAAAPELAALSPTGAVLRGGRGALKGFAEGMTSGAMRGYTPRNAMFRGLRAAAAQGGAEAVGPMRGALRRAMQAARGAAADAPAASAGVPAGAGNAASEVMNDAVAGPPGLLRGAPGRPRMPREAAVEQTLGLGEVEPDLSPQRRAGLLPAEPPRRELVEASTPPPAPEVAPAAQPTAAPPAPTALGRASQAFERTQRIPMLDSGVKAAPDVAPVLQQLGMEPEQIARAVGIRPGGQVRLARMGEGVSVQARYVHPPFETRIGDAVFELEPSTGGSIIDVRVNGEDVGTLRAEVGDASYTLIPDEGRPALSTDIMKELNDAITAKGAMGQSQDYRVITEDGVLTLDADYAVTFPKGTGDVLEAFAHAAHQARENGIMRMVTLAGQGDGYNGYYTWARLGFDGPLEPGLAEKYGVETVQELLDLEGGAQIWKREGHSYEGVFDLKDGSQSMGRLNEFVERTERRRNRRGRR